MTEEEKKKLRDAFVKNAKEEEEDPWTEEALLKVAEKILERLKRDDDKKM